MTIKEKAAAMKLDSTKMASQPAETRNRALSAIIKALQTNQEAIFQANAQDLTEAARARSRGYEKGGIHDSIY